MNRFCLGAGSRVQRSVGNDKRSSGKVDASPTSCAWSHLRLAIIPSASIFHQAEAHLAWPILVKELGNKVGIIDFSSWCVF